MVRGEEPRPPRGYSWEPFRPGHTLTLRHGAYSPRKVDPLAAEITASVFTACPWLEEPAWRLAVLALARAEAQARLLGEWLAVKADEAGDGVGDLSDPQVTAAYTLLHRAEARADRSRARLGLDPLSAARLGRDHAATGVDMAKLMAELEAREVLPGAAVADRDGVRDGDRGGLS